MSEQWYEWVERVIDGVVFDVLEPKGVNDEEKYTENDPDVSPDPLGHLYFGM